MLKKYLWKKAIKKACSATEGLEDTFANYLTKSPGVKRYFRLLTKANTSNNLYRNFVITIAFELYMCKRKEQKAWSLAFAILDNWFDLNKVDYLAHKTYIGNIFYYMTIPLAKILLEFIFHIRSASFM